MSVDTGGNQLYWFVIKNSRLTWFGHMECKDDTDWIKHCTMMEVEGTKVRRHNGMVSEERI